MAGDDGADDETLGGPPSGPGVGAGCASESRALAGKPNGQGEAKPGGKGGGSLADIIRRGREHRRETGLDVEVLVLTPPAGLSLPDQSLNPASSSLDVCSHAIAPAHRSIDQGNRSSARRGREDGVGGSSAVACREEISAAVRDREAGRNRGDALDSDMPSRHRPLSQRQTQQDSSGAGGACAALGASFKALSVVFEQDKSMAKTRSCISAQRDCPGQPCPAACVERDSLEMESSRGAPTGGIELRQATADHASRMELIRQQCEDVLGLE